ncbi:hypothetical protein B4U45_00940 [Mycobacterium persicum]|uniref:Uncharacterized protein n=1 Tax=Mycobacterium persicum TaxID=1487726 RepID=A0A8E2IQS4_9MYCO|nr:hypothetical protein A4G31_00915 [Mycobacterium persicum]ORB33104.1 hypothetical protein BST40_26915 [Mycobacterium persicum]ORB93371.1 hypothetical protein B1T44_00945 [Mycobacterium persicum]ORC05454.1 hypothetical protein B4U45_00940 [Mycobacterium persicum]
MLHQFAAAYPRSGVVDPVIDRLAFFTVSEFCVVVSIESEGREYLPEYQQNNNGFWSSPTSRGWHNRADN